jgi:TolB-like protein/Tfp pilus assembly protein PilF
MSLIKELRRRNVIRMAGLYLVGAWLLVQVAGTLLPIFKTPDWVLQVLVVLLALGFVPALVFSWIFELTPEGLKRESEIAPAASATPQTARRMDRMIIAMMALALGYFALDKFVLAPDRGQGDRDVSTTPAAADPATDPQRPPVEASSAAADPKSIAVLAFANMSADPDNEYFSDGVSEEILNALAQVKDLKVAGRTSSFYYKGRNEPLPAIGATLGVAHVLEGSVRKQGDRLRITAQLIRVSDGFHLWSETFDGNNADVFALQEDIARRVTRELKVALNAGQQDRLIDVGTRDPDAYALYLRATEVFNKRDVPRYEAAIANLQQALQLDPQFARAHSRLGTLYFVSASTAAPERYDELAARAIEAAGRASEINPKLAEPYALRGVIHQTGRRFGQARAEYQRALAVDPTDISTQFWQALLHCLIGDIAACDKGLDQTLRIDPLLPNALGWRARTLASGGDLAAAERMIERASEVGLRWSSITLSTIARKRGDLAQARAHSLDFHTIFGAGLVPEAAAAFAGASVGETEATVRTLRIIDDYLAAAPPRINALVPLTLIRIGEIERGLTLFAEHPTSNDSLFLGEVLGTRHQAEAWASPVFPDFLLKTGIAEYWDEFGAPEHCRKDAGGDYRCE